MMNSPLLHLKDERLKDRFAALEMEAKKILDSETINIDEVKRCNILITEIKKRINLLLSAIRSKSDNRNTNRQSKHGSKASRNSSRNIIRSPQDLQLQALSQLRRRVNSIRDKIHDRISNEGIEIL